MRCEVRPINYSRTDYTQLIVVWEDETGRVLYISNLSRSAGEGGGESGHRHKIATVSLKNP